MMVHTYNPSYPGGISRRIAVQDRGKNCESFSEKLIQAKGLGMWFK
jgi:hypothetical protein